MLPTVAIVQWTLSTYVPRLSNTNCARVILFLHCKRLTINHTIEYSILELIEENGIKRKRMAAQESSTNTNAHKSFDHTVPTAK